MKNSGRSLFIILMSLLVLVGVGVILLIWGGDSSTQQQKSSASTTKTSSSTTSASSLASSVAVEEVVRKVESADDFVVLDDNVDQLNKTNVSSQIQQQDFSALLAGDFSELVGTWKDGYGRTLVFDANGLVSDTSSIRWVYVKHGILGGDLAYGYAGAVAQYIPVGVDASVESIDGMVFSDVSDHTKNRLWFGHSASTISEPESYYYKVSDSSTLASESQETDSAAESIVTSSANSSEESSDSVEAIVDTAESLEE